MKKIPSPLVSLIPLIVLVALLFATIRTFGSDALSGGSQVSLLTTTAVCVLIGMGFYKIGWKDFELAIEEAIAMAREIIVREGIFAGMSSGAAMVAALKTAEQIDTGNIVVIFPDRAEKYLSTSMFGNLVDY